MATVAGSRPEVVKISREEYDRLNKDSRQLAVLRLVTSRSARWASSYGDTPAGELCRAFALSNLLFPAMERALTESRTPLPRERRVWDLALVEYLRRKD